MHLNSLFAKEKVHGWISFGFKNTSQVHYLIRGHPAVLPRPVLLDLTFPWAPCNLQGRAPLPVFASGPGQLWGLGGAGTPRSAACLYPNLRHVLFALFFVQPPHPRQVLRPQRGGSGVGEPSACGPVHQRKEVQL